MAPIQPKRAYVTSATNLDIGRANAQKTKGKAKLVETMAATTVPRVSSPGVQWHQLLELLKPSLQMGRLSIGAPLASVGQPHTPRRLTLARRRSQVMDLPMLLRSTTFPWSTILQFGQLRQL
jgi:hypothetical protein